ncbi:hypothetical protein DPMN_014342 [Dreissena polymorpha]|uniref:Uncharacterized protein n=1 Tax=Dreissena polymorpha TaxID=45954 RepID=A0A9D4S548_DREPO|nr:hypothetical protein DPMN_014342 [Dreissena polymorpha]
MPLQIPQQVTSEDDALLFIHASNAPNITGKSRIMKEMTSKKYAVPLRAVKMIKTPIY